MTIFRETVKVIVKLTGEIDNVWKDKFNPELHEEITEGEIVKPVEEITNPTEDESKPKRTRKSTKEAGEPTVSEEGDAEVRETVGE
jgi:hypothetical protein